MLQTKFKNLHLVHRKTKNVRIQLYHLHSHFRVMGSLVPVHFYGCMYSTILFTVVEPGFESTLDHFFFRYEIQHKRNNARVSFSYLQYWLFCCN